jgi:endonuclease/exonuclease/phosphatase (EEP) superfamily protein YafD
MFDPASSPEFSPAAPAVDVAPALRLLSWNLLRRVGAEAADVAELIERHGVDVALLQEACDRVEDLPGLVGGSFQRSRFPGRVHGPAIWARGRLARVREVPLDHGAAIRRHALTAEIDGVALASVHLSHGQLANRRQARQTVDALAGAAVIAGDFNMLGPLRLDGFVEVGPREPTHRARGVLPVRIDRCFVRGLACLGARALDRGPSDHRPILVDLAPAAPLAAAHARAA